LTSLSRWSKAKFKSPCNFEESPYVAARVFSPLVIYENVDIMHVFIEVYRIRILKVFLLLNVASEKKFGQPLRLHSTAVHPLSKMVPMLFAYEKQIQIALY
jgi:hypothetical protein